MSDHVMPKRSWIPILVSLGFALLWQVLSFVRAEPNTGLVDYLGFESWPELQSTLPEAMELLAVVLRFASLSTMGLIALATVVVLRDYRAGARWAWSALWIWPVVLLAMFVVDVTGFAGDDVGTFGVVFLQAAVLAIVGLLLGVRHRRPAAAPTREVVTG